MVSFSAVAVTGRIHWVGAVDWGVRSFHGYATPRGTTYNAYLVRGDRATALIDTVKAPFQEELLARIRSVMDPGAIDLIVTNHAEPDHAGCLKAVAAAVRPERILASPAAAKVLAANYGEVPGLAAVKEGEPVDLGGATLRFAETRMLHWPESMVTCCPEEGVLFSQDVFGLHYASTGRFDDQVDQGALEYEAAKYFANILTPMANLVPGLVKKLQGFGVAWRVLANDHGPLWRSRIPWIFERYAAWAERRPSRKAVVVFDTMWGATERLARALADGVAAGGGTAVVMPLQACHRADVATELLEAGALLLGSSTLNGQMLPTVADILAYLRGLKPRHLVGAVFGSFGWATQAVQQLAAFLEEMKIEAVAAPLAIPYAPAESDLERGHALGRQVAEALAARRA